MEDGERAEETRGGPDGGGRTVEEGMSRFSTGDGTKAALDGAELVDEVEEVVVADVVVEATDGGRGAGRDGGRRVVVG